MDILAQKRKQQKVAVLNLAIGLLEDHLSAKELVEKCLDQLEAIDAEEDKLLRQGAIL